MVSLHFLKLKMSFSCIDVIELWCRKSEDTALFGQAGSKDEPKWAYRLEPE